MTDNGADFGVRLNLAMKALNISRGALGSAARADKSLVSRWVRGLAIPRGPYLAVLTDIIRRQAPGFSQLSWDLPLDEFNRVLGGEADRMLPLPPQPLPPAAVTAEPPAAPPLASINMTGTEQSRPQSAEEVARHGHAYPGVYATFRLAFRNTGEIIPDLLIIWRQGNRLFFRVFDPSFSHTGEAFILRHQLFLVGEDDQRVDGLIYYILNGVSGQKAFRTDGVLMTVANDRHRTPGAVPVVVQRLLNLADEGEPPPFDLLAAISERMKTALTEGRIDAIAGPEIVGIARPLIGAPQANGLIDHLIRRPMDRSLAASEVELEPRITADIERARAAFLEDPALHPLPLGFVFSRVSQAS